MSTATLIIHDWESNCSACGGNAWPDETSHDRGGLPLIAGGGCGAEFTAVALHKSARGDGSRPTLRPDLPYVGRWTGGTKVVPS